MDAQYRIPFHTAKQADVVLTRGVLAGIGAALGLAALSFVGGAPPVLVFAVVFGMVHVPAAVILFVKQLRGSGKT